MKDDLNPERFSIHWLQTVLQLYMGEDVFSFIQKVASKEVTRDISKRFDALGSAIQNIDKGVR